MTMFEDHAAGKHAKVPRQKCPMCDGPGWQLSALCRTSAEAEEVMERLRPHVKDTMTKKRKGAIAVYFLRRTVNVK
jgi:hypothetical protein